MKKYKKKPVTIEAVQYHRNLKLPCLEYENHLSPWMDENRKIHHMRKAFIVTLEGCMYVNPGDWIIKGVEGEYYPCKDSIFKKTYEEVK